MIRSHSLPLLLSSLSMRSAKFGHGTNSNFMPIPVLAVKSFDSSTSALAGSHAAQHSVIVLPCACAGVAVAPIPSAATPPTARSTFNELFMRISLPCEPAIDMARRSCPLDGFERCDTVLDELNDLNRRSLALADSWDPWSSICLVNHGLLNIASGAVDRDESKDITAAIGN